MSPQLSVRRLLPLVLAAAPLLPASNGPDPLLSYAAKARFLAEDGTLSAQRGPALPLGDQVQETENGLFFPGLATPAIPAPADHLPTEAFTIAAWASVHRPLQYGGIIGALEDTGSHEKGWVLGYDQSRFYVGLATAGADDGDGVMTYLLSRTEYKKGKLYHVAATYDGTSLTLFVNGEAESSTEHQSGAILYPDGLQLSLGGYKDSNEDHPHRGQIISAAVYGQAAAPEWVAQEFAHNTDWASEEVPASLREPLSLVVRPYLQAATTEGITVMWETNETCVGQVFYGETSACSTELPTTDEGTIHELRIGGLKPGTQYFYKAVSTLGEESVEAEVRTFQTDAGPETPFAFAVISDTQGNPEVSGTFANYAWSHRPNFLLHPGDLVSTGGNKHEWVEQFFASMEPLVSRAAFFPVLGNHEQNADNYYNYVSLPEPEYHYTFRYGNAQFFMVDTNKKCDPDSEQYKWLAQELESSKATWKFACHHHPPYTSDENDYGNLWEGNVSTRGDTNAQHLTDLYDTAGVDIVWNGHIHSYERTWPIHDGRPVADGEGPIYMITGGGGGGLETPGPFRNPWGHLVRRGHHYAMVWINGETFSYKAYDLEGTMFDSFTLEK